jgi:hypothetical protein
MVSLFDWRDLSREVGLCAPKIVGIEGIHLENSRAKVPDERLMNLMRLDIHT